MATLINKTLTRGIVITMQEWDGHWWQPDWSNDFFEGSSQIVEDIDYCIEQAEDWKNGIGDYREDNDVNPDDRAVDWYELSIEEIRDEIDDCVYSGRSIPGLSAIIDICKAHVLFGGEEHGVMVWTQYGKVFESDFCNESVELEDTFENRMELIKDAEKLVVEWCQGVDVRNLTDEQLALAIYSSDCWDYEWSLELCRRAGMKEEFENADGFAVGYENTPESVILAAAEKLGVEII